MLQYIKDRLDELKRLDEDSKNRCPKWEPLNLEKIKFIEEMLDKYYSQDLPDLYIYPTSEGLLSVEWPKIDGSPTLEIDVDFKGNYYRFVGDNFVELDFDLSTNTGWLELIDYIKEYLN